MILKVLSGQPGCTVFFPDFLKCITILRYRKAIYEDKKHEIDRINKFVVETIKPFSLSKIIYGILDNYMFSQTITPEMRSKIKTSEPLKNVLNQFNDAADRTREAQFMLRQIAFWAETDYMEMGTLAEDTWSAFTLQVWIIPDTRGLAPRYDQRTIAVAAMQGDLLLLASRDGRAGSIQIQQDVALYGAYLAPGGKLLHSLAPGR